ncbi:hypothetical protein CDD83_9523 [Cordyceps sp. RAO-2017]|nr:hypothetical protein CDD83_9523 [Cordyceps sp. RAO-2017]
MPKSLHLAPRSTPDGNLIPVRQPRSSRLRGLRAVRNGILRSLTNLSDLKREEDAHVDAALSERKMALTRLRRLDARRSGIRDELKALESDDEEPLGRELRELGSEHDVLEEEIHRLEEKLVGMRNRRRWLRDKMDDVKSRRDAGLSGYRGALRDVDAEISALLHRPPVLPLDQDISRPWKDADAEPEAPAGLAFMRLIPERRTLDMAMAWWETEIRMLERTRALVEEEQQALEQGGAVWEEVVTLVTSFESGLREAMKSGKGSAAPSPATSGEEASAQEDLIRRQLIRMDEVTKELAQRMQLAESKRWNLLICAIGAELEAFREASGMFRRLVAGNDAGLNVTEDTVEKNLTTPSDKSTPGNADPASGGGPGRDCSHEESDNEVPADLLVSHLDDAESLSGTAATLGRGDSSNAVPPEFLVEHDHDRSTLTPMAMP